MSSRHIIGAGTTAFEPSPVRAGQLTILPIIHVGAAFILNHDTEPPAACCYVLSPDDHPSFSPSHIC